MSNTIKGRSFNIRVSFNEVGEPCIGFVRGFYKASEVAVDIQAVPDSIIRQIAKALGIKKSESVMNLSKNPQKYQNASIAETGSGV